MVCFADVANDAAPLAALIRERFDGPGLILLGTLRIDGRPRISPVEPLFLDGQLYLGMMWRSMKALDLRRDPRCVVHSLVTTKDSTEGDVKVYGTAVEVTDPDERDRYGVALEAAIGWRPTGDFHLFTVDIDEVGYIRVDGATHRVWHWRPGQDLGPLQSRPGSL
jgi:hypothetical protein